MNTQNFKVFSFVIVNFLQLQEKLFSAIVSFFVLAIIVSTSKVHAKECSNVLLFMYNVELISMELLIEEFGMALTEPRNLIAQMENIRQLQEEINS